MSQGRRGVCSSSGSDSTWYFRTPNGCFTSKHLRQRDFLNLVRFWEIKICLEVFILLCSCVNYGLPLLLVSMPSMAKQPLVGTWDELDPVLPQRSHVTRQEGRLHTYFNQDFYNTRPEGKTFWRGCAGWWITRMYSWPCCMTADFWSDHMMLLSCQHWKFNL